MPIHPTAVVGEQVSLGNDVEVGPYAIIDGPVALGDGCSIGAHAQILGPAELAEGNRIGPGAIIGGLPQDLSFEATTISHVRIGSGNDIREHVTIHRSATECGATVVGDKNFLMVGCHVGHDCQIGNDNIFANNCLLGGHVIMGNAAFIGGATMFHQFSRVGDRVMTQGNSGFSLDLPPFVIGYEHNLIAGLNSIGMRRAGLSAEARAEIKDIFRLFYRARLSKAEALAQASQKTWGAEAEAFLTFMKSETRKGVCLRMKTSH